MDLTKVSDEELERMVGETFDKIEQRKQQQEALKMMISEQETEFLNVSHKNEQLEKDYKRAKTQFETASKVLQLSLKSKEDLFVKLQRVQSEIDSMIN